MSYDSANSDMVESDIDEYVDPETELYNTYHKLANEFKQKQLATLANTKLANTKAEWTVKNVSELKINDKIVVYFYPDSQRYINQLYPKYGTVVKILSDDEMDIDKEILNELYSDIDLERVIISTEDNDEIVVAHPWTSYYGNSRGYFYTIDVLSIIN
jgi:hypothetical protein